MHTIKRILAPPVFPDDEDKTHQAFILHVIVGGLILVPVPYVLYTLLAIPGSASRALAQTGFGEAVNLFLLLLLRHGKVRLASILQIITFWTLFTAIAFTGGGVRGQGYLLGYGLVIVISGILLGGWGALATTVASLISGGVMAIAEINGWLKFAPLDSAWSYWIASFALFPLSALVQNLAARTVRRALERVRLSESRYRALIEESPEGILIVNAQRRITLANPMAYEILGYPPGELIGRDAFSLIDPHDLANHPLETDSLTTGATLRQERLFIHQDGRRIPIIGSAKRMPDGRFEIIFQDISARKEIERENARRANELRALYEASLAINAQTDMTPLLQSIATHAATLLGMQRGSIYLLQPDQTLELVIQFNIPSSYQGIRLKLGEGVAGRVVQSGKPVIVADYRDWEYRAKIFDNVPSRRILGVPLRARNRIIGSLNVTDAEQVGLFSEDEVRLLSLFSDQAGIAVENVQLFAAAQQELHERRRVETERETLIKELEAKNAELERFTYTVSHDLKSPLITMRGFLGYLERDAQAGDTNRLKADLARIVSATDRMQQLLNELLELSRIGRLINPPETLPFESIAHEAASLVEGQLSARNVRISIQFGMPNVYGDHVRLVEVMQNLMDNAVKFMGNQPHPQIDIGTHGLDKDGKPVFFVRDNGMGIEIKYHSQVFGLFNKLDAKTDGTGIGLALVKRIIEVHGGRIWVESEGIGKGSTFYFTLPYHPVEHTPASP